MYWSMIPPTGRRSGEQADAHEEFYRGRSPSGAIQCQIGVFPVSDGREFPEQGDAESRDGHPAVGMRDLPFLQN